jgi:hypothetical protein
MTSDGLLVKGPKQRGLPRSLVGPPFGKPGSVDVTIGLPAGSRLRADTGLATLRSTGRLGACQVKTGAGEIDLENTGPANVTTGAGGISDGALRVGRVSRGITSLKTSVGEIEIGIAAGTAARVDAQTRLGSLRNGLAATDRPEPADETAEVQARTAYGDIIIRRA